MTTATTTNTGQILQTLELDRFFDEQALSYDFIEGTVINPGQTRVIYLSSDIILGIYHALKEETGPAWSLILKNCGRIWGQKVARNLEREMTMLKQVKPADLSALDFTKLLETYFPAHGWGLLQVDLTDAVSHGLVRFTMKNSLFASVLEEETCPVDSMIAGILQGFFIHLTGESLDCLEIGCERQGYRECTFVLTHEERLFDLAEDAENGRKSPEELYQSLKI
ncbi:MAG: hypothetical protein LAT55_07805 [Opitutales bacterium]|nr:hypothetical protein [Opitutales bacterium]